MLLDGQLKQELMALKESKKLVDFEHENVIINL